MKLRYIIGIFYLCFIGLMGHNVLVEAIFIGVSLGVYDLFFDDHGGDGGRPV